MIGTGLVRNTSGGTCVCGGGQTPQPSEGPATHCVADSNTMCGEGFFPKAGKMCRISNIYLEPHVVHPTSKHLRGSVHTAFRTRRYRLREEVS